MDEARRVRAAQYVRMSTEHQRYSIEYQTTTNLGYATERGYELVRTYKDAGISGLSLKGRAGLQALLADVLGGRADFEVVLIYDVSRWGRFQDPDQSAHYEFLCREAGIRLEYTAEPFENDASLASSLIKHLKRAMAAEYSRELSAKVSRAKVGIRNLGYWTGGPAPYGLQRVPVDPEGRRGAPLSDGEHKGVRGHRVILTPGDAREVETVRRMFHLYAVTGLRMKAIAQLLNDEGAPCRPGPTWTEYRVRRVLTNETLAGTLVGGRHIYRLQERTPQPRRAWVRVPNAFEPVVSPKQFAQAQEQLRILQPRLTNEQLLERLRVVWKREGRLSRHVLDAAPDCHCAGTYHNRFNGLMRAYALIGYTPSRRQLTTAARVAVEEPWRYRAYRPPSDDELLERLRALLREHGRLSVDIINTASGPHSETYRRRFGCMRRLYALVGYEPSRHQEAVMDGKAGQNLTREEAAWLRASRAARSAAGPNSADRDSRDDEEQADR